MKQKKLKARIELGMIYFNFAVFILFLMNMSYMIETLDFDSLNWFIWLYIAFGFNVYMLHNYGNGLMYENTK